MTSPARPAHPDCVRAALTAAGLVGDEQAERVRCILTNIDDRICPRCGAALGQFPGRSRITEDRCIPVCGECGSHETSSHLPIGPPAASIADWPLDASELRAEFRTVVRQLDNPATS